MPPIPDLIERQSYHDVLETTFENVQRGVGHSIFIMGEAGIGKTSLVNAFVNRIEGKAIIYSGACDSLIYPRPLGPLYDVASQVSETFEALLTNEKDRTVIFNAFLEQLGPARKPIVIIFEDVHWADEATIDLIKVLARRIHKLKCLFLLTIRNDELPAGHPLKSIFAELMPGTFTNLHLQRLSQQAVNEWSKRVGYASGDDVYTLTGGNPFYVSEVLASSDAIPSRVMDSVLGVYNSKAPHVRELWEFLSVLPSRIDWEIARMIDVEFPGGIDQAVALGVLISRSEFLSFKHELYRLAIEQSLSPLRKRALHQKVVSMMRSMPAGTFSLSQFVHHARFADDRALVAELAPKAAREAASLRSHLEASRLFATALEFISPDDPSVVELYEQHAYECYLTNQMPRAIASQRKALEIWRHRKMILKEGNALRFLSRLLWFQGKTEEVDRVALEAVQVLENGFPTRERAMGYSNLSQLYALADNADECIRWGEKAIELATRMEDQEILSHALNNVGYVLMKFPGREKEGESNLMTSLNIALKHNYQEHAARAYTNLCSSYVMTKQFTRAKELFEEGIAYCEAHDLASWSYYMLSEKAHLLLQLGWIVDAEKVATMLYANQNNPNMVRIGAMVTLARIRMRKGDFEEAASLIEEARVLAIPTNEPIRVVPVLAAAMELAWLKNEKYSSNDVARAEQNIFSRRDRSWHFTDLMYWKHKVGLSVTTDGITFTGPFQQEIHERWEEAAEEWHAAGCKYEYAMALSQMDEASQKRAIEILNDIGFVAAVDLFREKMRLKGMRNIPRGPHQRTRSNPAQLTSRQIEILRLLQSGLQNKEIAEKLFISLKTVDAHVSAILSKLEVNSRAKAVVEAQKLGILE